jgi:formate C-acetyltransferase
VVEAFTKYRTTHNDAVFDAYTADVARCRSSHVLTGLPDAYGRGRIIGDYRRVALYGVDRLIERKKERRSGLDRRALDRRHHPRPRGARRADPALGELQQMAQAYGSTWRARPHREGSRPVAVLRYLAAVKEQYGAAMSLGRTSTFLDVYFERDLAAGVLTEQQAQEIVDDFVIKLRIVRFMRTLTEFDELFARRPRPGATESSRRDGDDGRSLVTKDELPLLADALQPRPGPRSQLNDWYRQMTEAPPLLREGLRSRHELDPVRSDEIHAPRLG